MKIRMPHSRVSSLSPGRIALAYAVIAILWIAFSDAVVTRLNLPPAVMTIKGAAFVFVTASLLYFTIRRLVQAVQLTSEALREQADLLNLTHDTVFVMDMEGTIKYWNRGAEEQYGWSAEQAVGRVVHDLLKTVLPAPVEQIKVEVTRTGRWEGELVHTKKDGIQVVVASRWSLQHDKQGVPVAILETNNDITERKRAEDALRRSNRELRAISNCNQVLLRANDEQSLLKEICRIVCDEAGYRVAWVGYAEHDEAKSVRPVAWTGVEYETLADLVITWADTERGRGPSGTAIRTGRTSCLEDYATDHRGAPWRESALQHGFRSAIALPLKDEHGNTFGSLNIYSSDTNAFNAEEIRLLEELAGDLAFGIVTLRSRAAREQAEQKVAMLSFALDNVHEAAFLMDEARLWYVNEEACRRLGYTRGELLGMRVSDIDPDFPAERWADHWRDLKARQSLTFESRHRTRDGRTFPVEISANYFEYGGRAYNLALVRDITERKRAEEQVRQAQAAQFEIRLETRVMERTRIARELHDTLLQSFQGLLLRHQSVLKMLPDRPLEARQRLESTLDQAAEAITDARVAIQGLRSLAAETSDLARVITAVGAELTAHRTDFNSPAIYVGVEGAPRNLKPAVRDEAYRIANEAMRNAFRHAQARRITVEIRYDKQHFKLTVRDDGKGFDEATMQRQPGHFGLPGMRERAQVVGGHLEVCSKLNSGTQVELSIPGSIAYYGASHQSVTSA